jgi:drug/metabolite transporter (DMT)-like permease
MLPMVACFCAMNWLYLTAMVQVEASIAIWLQSTAPIWVFLASIVIHSEKIVPADWKMLAGAATGMCVILIFQAHQSPSQGLWFALLSGVMYAGVVVSLRYLRGCDAVWLILLNHLVTALVFAPFALTNEIVPNGNQWWFLAGFGALQMGLPYVIFAHGLKRIPGHEASLIGLIEPIMVPVWVFLAWRSHPTYTPPHWSTLLGGGFILIALAQRYTPALRRNRPAIES